MIITIKNIVDEDFVNYKKPSMFIAFPHCDFKCEKECNMQVCQNSTLATSLNIEIDTENIVTRYLNNDISNAIVIGGLEPFDDFENLINLIKDFRDKTNDDIVIFTGYYKKEIINKIKQLKQYTNIIIKFGRYIPNQSLHYDETLGVNLASNNQYAEKLS